jgi:hypothetical protein
MIIFNDAQTVGYSTQFNYLGNAFNYNNSSTINVKGRMISDKTFDGIPNSFFGIAYVNDGGIWVPLNGFDGLSTGVTSEYSGNLSFDGGNAYVSLLDSNNSIVENLYFSGDYSPLYDIWEEMDRVKDKFQDFQAIYLNGILIGSGRVTSINFPESIDPRKSNYEAKIELYKDGDLYNLSGSGYNSISIDNAFCKYVSGLDESFDFATDKDGVVSYKRSLSFDCINPNMADSGILSGVKSFASGIIFNDPGFQAAIKTYPDFYQEQGSRYFSESYNPIQGSYNFSETFQGPTSGEHYRWSNNFSMSLQGEGLSTISEKGLIVGVKKDILSSAYVGISEVQASALSRANSFYASYNSTSGACSSGLSLKSTNKTINREAGTIEYSFEYSNDPFSNNCYEVSRELDFSKDDNGLSTLSEKGSVKNICEPTNSGKLSKAIQYFNTNISGGILGRVFSYYQSNVSGCGCSGLPASGDLRNISTENSYSEFEGLFGYSYVYRNDCTSLTEGCFYVTKEKNTTDSIHNVYLAITPYSGEIAQKQNTSSLVSQSQSISILSICSGKTIQDYLNIALANVEIPAGNTYFMESADYSFDPDNSKLNLNISYNNSGYRAYTSYNV